jgi:uncharacterized phage protein (TIGR01671 family)
MREHLYSGRRARDGKWVYGFYYTTEGKNFILGNENPDSDIQMAYDVIPETVGEYTGLLDNNGVRIFEGSIVRHGKWEESEKFPVVWDDDECRFGIDVSENKNLVNTWEDRHVWPLRKNHVEPLDIIVVGNIFDNLEIKSAKMKEQEQNSLRGPLSVTA